MLMPLFFWEFSARPHWRTLLNQLWNFTRTTVYFYLVLVSEMTSSITSVISQQLKRRKLSSWRQKQSKTKSHYDCTGETGSTQCFCKDPIPDYSACYGQTQHNSSRLKNKYQIVLSLLYLSKPVLPWQQL